MYILTEQRLQFETSEGMKDKWARYTVTLTDRPRKSGLLDKPQASFGGSRKSVTLKTEVTLKSCYLSLPVLIRV